MFGLKKKISLTKEEIAELLRMATGDAIGILNSDDFFKINAKQAVDKQKELLNYSTDSNELVEQVVKELVSKTVLWSFDGTKINNTLNINPPFSYITNNDLKNLPLEDRPMLTGNLLKCDLEPGTTSSALLFNYKQYKNAKNVKDKKSIYIPLSLCTNP